MHIAFIGHPYHQATRSSGFILEILSELGKVSCFYEHEQEERNEWAQAFNERDYDLIVVWQVHESFRRLSGKHPNVVFAPMYDTMQTPTGFYWEKKFSRAKVLSFCRRLHRKVTRHNATSRYFRYFPNPADHEVISDYGDIRAFFWYRRNPIDSKLVFDLCGSTRIAKFLLHDAPDPEMAPLGAVKPTANIGTLERSSWFEGQEAYRDAMRQCNVFFAPRVVEGIGMSFLEAMASGLCVVAPNMPTMNEYITNHVNGLLYSPTFKFCVDFSGLREIGSQARESIEIGYRVWKEELPALMDFLATPKDRLLLADRSRGYRA